LFFLAALAFLAVQLLFFDFLGVLGGSFVVLIVICVYLCSSVVPLLFLVFLCVLRVLRVLRGSAFLVLNRTCLAANPLRPSAVLVRPDLPALRIERLAREQPGLLEIAALKVRGGLVVQELPLRLARASWRNGGQQP
jgi:hypothetical protein